MPDQNLPRATGSRIADAVSVRRMLSINDSPSKTDVVMPDFIGLAWYSNSSNTVSLQGSVQVDGAQSIEAGEII